MAFNVKPVNGEERRMELAHIREALKNGIIAENWLVRDERQDFWYSIGKLVGKVKSQPISLFCPRCRAPIPARHIDVGLPVACGKCGTQVIVPDPLDAERRLRDEHLLVEVRKRAVFSGIALAAGLLVTILTYGFPDPETGIWLLWWGPLAFGLGTFIVCFPQYLELKRKLKKGRSPGSAKEVN